MVKVTFENDQELEFDMIVAHKEVNAFAGLVGNIIGLGYRIDTVKSIKKQASDLRAKEMIALGARLNYEQQIDAYVLVIGDEYYYMEDWIDVTSVIKGEYKQCCQEEK